MRRTLIGIIVFGFFSTGYAQKPPIKFGDIADELLTMKSYEPDSTAEAVVLADFGETTMFYNDLRSTFEFTFQRTRRIKVLTEAGKKWADLTIQLYRDSDQSEKLNNIKGVTVNLVNGKAVESKLRNDAVFKEKYNKNVELVKVTLPNVQAGSVFDITYSITSNFLFNLQDWDFQTTIPVVWSEYRVGIPEYFIYDKYMQGYIPIKINESSRKQKKLTFSYRDEAPGQGGQRSNSTNQIDYTEENFRWVATDVPAFRDEPYMTTRKDFISRMNFELAATHMPGGAIKNVTGSWTEINQRFAESDNSVGELSGNGFLRKLAEELTASATSTKEKIALLHAYVSHNITWNGDYRLFTEKSLKQVLEEKKGTSAEVNLLLGSMIEKLGIAVRPVVLSTRDHGFVREATPALSQFNNVICAAAWEDKVMLLDATDPYLPLGLLPANCLNGKGMAVDKNGPEWLNLESAKAKEVTNCELQLSADGVLAGVLKKEYDGYRALEHRKKYLADGADAHLKDIIGGRQWQVSNSEYTNAKELNETFKEKHDVAIDEHIMVAGDVMYMNPFVAGHWQSNPFKSQTREYPVDFGSAFDEVYILRLRVPEGYVVDELPASKAVAMPGNSAKYLFSAAVNGNLLSVTSMLSMNKTIFNSQEYANLREFYNQVVAKQTEQIVIKKK